MRISLILENPMSQWQAHGGSLPIPIDCNLRVHMADYVAQNTGENVSNRVGTPDVVLFGVGVSFQMNQPTSHSLCHAWLISKPT